MPGRASEGSPLLDGAADPARDWGDANRKGSAGRHALPLGGEERRKCRRRQRRHWRLSAAVAGVLAFSMALAGLAGVFSAIKGEGSPRDAASPALQMEEAGDGKAAAAASERLDRREIATAGVRCRIM